MSIDDIRKLNYKEEGREEGIEKIAINMLKKGKSIEDIMEAKELSYEKIVELKSEYKN